jgi:hypothetical protein
VAFGRFTFPANSPGGPRVFVNTVDRTDDGDTGGVSMHVEIQSGDEIRIRASSLEIV